MPKKIMADAARAGKMNITPAVPIDGCKVNASVFHGKGSTQKVIKLE